MIFAALLLTGFVVGVVAWTFAEYLLHRFVMHAAGGGLIGREHRAHHRDPLRTNLLHRLGGYVGLAAIGVVLGLPALPLGPGASIGVAIGWTVGYVGYEQIHWRSHHRAPRTSFGLRRRHLHLHHHFVRPRCNHGVSTSLWDRVFATYCEPGVVLVPRTEPPPWLRDSPSRYADHFQVR